MIQHYPGQPEALKELEPLGKGLEHLSQIKESLKAKTELRRKHFHGLLSTLHQLQLPLGEEEKLSELEEAEDNSIESDDAPETG